MPIETAAAIKSEFRSAIFMVNVSDSTANSLLRAIYTRTVFGSSGFFVGGSGLEVLKGMLY